MEDERRRARERELVKLKKEEAMREVLAAAERKAKEEKRKRRQREQPADSSGERCADSNCWDSPGAERTRDGGSRSVVAEPIVDQLTESTSSSDNVVEKALTNLAEDCSNAVDDETRTVREEHCHRVGPREESTLDIPVSQEVAIVLSGRLENPDFFNRSNIQLVNLVVTPAAEKNASSSTNPFDVGLNTLSRNLANPVLLRGSSVSPRLAENRLLTPSKYRSFAAHAQARDFGTQTDGESEVQDNVGKDFAKELKDVVNNNRRDVEK